LWIGSREFVDQPEIDPADVVVAIKKKILCFYIAVAHPLLIVKIIKHRNEWEK
jgi:hypothetical protein